MQSSYRGRGQIEGNADLINTKAYIGRNEGTLGNTINLLATLYKGYKNIPPDVRWKLFGDQKALLEDQRSKDGGVIDPTTGDYYTLPFQAEAEDYSNETSGDSELDAKYPNVPADLRAMVDDLNRRNRYQAEADASLSELEDLEPPDMPVSVEADTSFDVSGMTKNDIRRLQKELIDKKFLEPTYTTKSGKKVRSDDGVFGSETAKAYQAYLDEGNQYGEDEWGVSNLRTPTDEMRMYGRSNPTGFEYRTTESLPNREDMSVEIRANQPFFERDFQEPSFDFNQGQAPKPPWYEYDRNAAIMEALNSI